MTELGLFVVVLMMLMCAVVMGGMILMMWRGMRHGKTAEPQPDADRHRGRGGT
jgi:flagellar basal body-associated protein FliL